jgi:hypothetical protein
MKPRIEMVRKMSSNDQKKEIASWQLALDFRQLLEQARKFDERCDQYHGPWLEIRLLQEVLHEHHVFYEE